MSEPLNWDEFRIVRAIAETRSLTGAAERLGLNHSTMFRRLSAVERWLGVRLFERERGGYRATAAGEDMVALAVLMGDTIAEFERRVAARDVQVSGLVRITTIFSLGVLAMPQALAALRVAHPTLQVELMLNETILDLQRGEADIALRAMREAPQDDYTGRRIAALPWAIYATRALLDPAGALLRDASWVAPTENCGQQPARGWLDRNVAPWRRATLASNVLAMAELAACGVGAALLPCFAAARHPQLVRIGVADLDFDRHLWLVANAQALRAPRVRAAYEFLGETLAQRRAWFEGEGADV